MNNSGQILNGVEIVAALVKGDRTINGIQAITGCDRRTISRWLNELHASGLVVMNGMEEKTGRGSRARVYSWQHTPFERADR